MSRYDPQGYRQLRGIDSSPRRQILGYSRLAQGGADQARARAEQRLALARDPAAANAQRRSRRVAEAKADGTFDETRDDYNEEGQAAGMEMDKSGNIRKKTMVNVGYTGDTKYTPKKPASMPALDYSRPAGQRITDAMNEASDMSKPEGLLDMAKKARRRNTYVIP